MRYLPSYALAASILVSTKAIGVAAVSYQTRHEVNIAHASLNSAAWVVVLPLGAIAMALTRHQRVWVIHTCIQVLGLLLVTAGAATGIWFPRRKRALTTYHAIIGLTLFACAWLQATGGYLSHVLYKRHRARTIVGHVHLWLGRVLITLGMINGGLGLYLGEEAGRKAYIVYGVVSGVIWVLFSGASVHREVSQRQRVTSEPGEYTSSSDNLHNVCPAHGVDPEKIGPKSSTG